MKGRLKQRVRWLETATHNLIDSGVRNGEALGASIRAQLRIVDRVKALEKNCHEPQEIEPRVIRALIKFGIIAKSMDGLAWLSAPRQRPIDRGLWHLLDAQAGVSDDAPSPPCDTPWAIAGNLCTGSDLDALADMWGLRKRSKGETDAEFRPQVIQGLAAHHGGRAPSAPEPAPVQQPNDEAGAFLFIGDRLDKLAAKYGLGRDPEMSDDTFRPIVVNAVQKALGLLDDVATWEAQMGGIHQFEISPILTDHVSVQEMGDSLDTRILPPALCQPPQQYAHEPFHWIQQGNGRPIPAAWLGKCDSWSVHHLGTLGAAYAGERGYRWAGVARPPAPAALRAFVDDATLLAAGYTLDEGSGP